MGFDYYFVYQYPTSHYKRYYSLEQAQTFHKAMWLWKSENPLKLLEEWPGFDSNGGECPIPFMYQFTCDLTKDKLGVRRCADCPYKWIDRETHKAVGRWSPWHWCDYPGALMENYFKFCEKEEYDKAKNVAIQISELTLSAATIQLVTKHSDVPSYEELAHQVQVIKDLSPVTDPETGNRHQLTIVERDGEKVIAVDQTPLP